MEERVTNYKNDCFGDQIYKTMKMEEKDQIYKTMKMEEKENKESDSRKQWAK